jgi:DNA polymerase III, alpha subunit
VMLLSRLLADFTRGESDALRKAMGKKLRDKLDHMKPKFIEGGRKNGQHRKYLKRFGRTGKSLRLTLSISHTLLVTHGSLIRQLI